MRLLLVVIVLVSGCVSHGPEPITISRAVDGDTIELSSGETVRLLCLDTPETGEEGYVEALSFTEQFVGSDVEMESADDNRDRYGRLLRIVTADGRNLNRELIERGLAEILVTDASEEACDRLING